MPSGIAMLACCLLSAFLCGVAPARAQDAAAAKAEHPVAIPVADILSRADAIDSRLTRIDAPPL